MFEMKLPLLWIILTGLIIQSCNLINPSEQIPSYLQINNVSVNTTALQGSNSHRIIDIYLIIDNESAGSDPVGSTVPLLVEGQHSVVMSAGISVNGIAAARGIYPFYKSYSTTLNFIPEQVITVSPVFEYTDNAIFKWMENFEDPGTGIGFITSVGTSAEINFLPAGDPDIFEGISSGVIRLNSSYPGFEIETSLSFTLPKGNNVDFLEINYKCSTPFEIGVISNYPQTGPQQTYIITVNKKSEWNKLYVDLTSVPANNRDAADFKLYMKGSLTGNNSEAVFYFDNLKIVHN